MKNLEEAQQWVKDQPKEWRSPEDVQPLVDFFHELESQSRHEDILRLWITTSSENYKVESACRDSKSIRSLLHSAGVEAAKIPKEQELRNTLECLNFLDSIEEKK